VLLDDGLGDGTAAGLVGTLRDWAGTHAHASSAHVFRTHFFILICVSECPSLLLFLNVLGDYVGDLAEEVTWALTPTALQLFVGAGTIRRACREGGAKGVCCVCWRWR
jgi:hypothetical protein